jgi:hypothetical protein
MEPRYLSPEREAVFPKLRREDYHVTSEEDWTYNCIAYAAGRSDAPWWPIEEDTEGVVWPEGLAREETLACFILAFQTLRYVPCESSALEEGVEKIAIFVNTDGTPAHAAKQLPSGAWTSKLGDWEDIEHKTLANLEGDEISPAYGRAIQIMKRERE